MQHFSGSYKASTVDIVDGMNLTVVSARFLLFKVLFISLRHAYFIQFFVAKICTHYVLYKMVI